jgi:HSP20 family molecular chaperone IbpA
MPQRECVTLRDMTDCLLQAYDCVARRAYEIFLERGGKSGGELDDWLSAEQELLGSLAVDLAEGEDYVSALASLPGLSGAEIEIGIDPRWIVILGRRDGENDFAEFYPDPHRVAEFSRAVHTDPRMLRLASANACRVPENGDNQVASSPRSEDESTAFPDRAPACIPQESGREAIEPGQCRAAQPASAPGATPTSADPARSSSGRAANPGSSATASSSKLFCVLELPAEVDPERSVAVLANGILGIRMPKAVPPLGAPC